MTVLALLGQVTAVGVHMRVVGDDLAIRPRGVLPDHLRAQLVGSKTQMLALLDPEIHWRAEAMSRQVPVWPAPVLTLMARHDVQPASDFCFSCGDPLEPMALPPAPRRCKPCRQAAWLVLEDWPMSGRS